MLYPALAPVKPARLFIHERCARLIECLPLLQHDPNRPEDVLKMDCDEDGLGGDDTAAPNAETASRNMVCDGPSRRPPSETAGTLRRGS
jgi:hypothetical protein